MMLVLIAFVFDFATYAGVGQREILTLQLLSVAHITGTSNGQTVELAHLS